MQKGMEQMAERDADQQLAWLLPSSSAEPA